MSEHEKTATLASWTNLAAVPSRRSPFLMLACLGMVLATVLMGCVSTQEDQKLSTTGASQPGATTPPPAAQVQPQSLVEKDLRIQELSARENSGQTTLLLRLNAPISQYRHFPVTRPSRIVIDIFGHAKPVMEAQKFSLVTAVVNGVRVTASEGYLRITVDTASASPPPYVVTPENGALRIVVGAVDAQATIKRDFVLVKEGKSLDAGTVHATSAAMSESGQPSRNPDSRSEAEKYTGQKLSFDFKDADIKNVFRLLAEVSGLNIVVTADVNRRVTLRLVEVPWDQAMDLLIATNGLAKEQIGNIVRISTAGALKAERDALLAAKKSEENLEPLHTVYFNLNYAKVKELEPKVKTLLSKRPDATLISDERSNTMMVRDIKKTVDDVSALIAKLDARTPQILIESNIIETSPTFARALGTKLQFTRGGFTFTSDFTPGSGTAAAGVSPIVSIVQDRVGGLTNLSATLTAAENEGLVKVISRPSVVTLNNVASTIQSLRILRIALPSSTNIASGTGSAAGAAVATQTVPTGIILSVTPQVSSDGFILMSISVKSSSVAPTASPSSGAGSGGVIPFDEISREAIANVLVRDGETIVVGGILKDTSESRESGVPWLKDVPVLGWLFKTNTWRKEFEEMMVFITPRVAAAGSGDLPTAEELWREQLRKTQGRRAGSPAPPSSTSP